MMRYGLVSLTMLAVLAACDRDAGVGPGAVINIEAPASRLAEGESVALRVRAGGQLISNGSVQWVSRDPSTVTVGRDGVARGVAPGVAYVVAHSGQARDSVQITVRFRQLASGVALRVAGAGNQPVRLGGAALLMRGANNGVETTTIYADNRTVDPSAASREVFALGDSVLHIWMPRRPDVGVSSVGAPVVEMTDHLAIRADSLGNGVFFTVWENNPQRERLYIAVKPVRLEVASLELPPAPGNQPGRVTGSIVFEAASFQLTFGEQGQQTLTPLADTTVLVYAEFSTPIYHTLIAGGQVTLAGPPRHAGTFSVFPTAVASTSGGAGGVTVRIGPTLANRNQIGAEYHLDHYLWIPNPAPGTVTFGEFPAAYLADSAGGTVPWSRAQMRAFTRTDPRFPSGQLGPPEHALSRGGSLRIVSYQPPTQTAYGLLELADVSIAHGYWTGGGFTSETLTLTRQAPLKIPVVPLGGDPMP